MQLFVTNKERIPDRSFVRSYQRKETKKRVDLARDISADELLRDAFRHPKDISRVFVVVPHQRFTSELSIPGRIKEPFCNLFLEIDVQDVGGAPGRIM